MIERVVAVWILGIAMAAAQTTEPTAEQTTTREAVPVQVRELAALLSPVVFTAPAEVVTANRSRLSARIEARIETMLVDVGDEVRTGQALAALDCTDHELARQLAEAQLQSARAQSRRSDQQLARSETLARDRLLSEDLLEQRQTEKEAAQAEARRAAIALDQARLAVDRCRIESPFEGVVTRRLAANGELARPGTPLLEIVDLQSIEVAAQVFPAERKHLTASPRVFFRFLDNEFSLRVDRSVSVIDPVTRNMEVRLKFVNKRAPVGAGGRVVWHGPDPGIPAGLLVQRGDQLGIFLARDDWAVFHPLPAALEGRPATVELPAKTLIVTEGRHALQDGDSLKIPD